MNYPVWELTTAGGGLLIALIAVFHVYIAHFAVGGGLFLVLTEIKGHRQGSTAILDYTKRHAWFFMLLTMVAGGITGVGIWFIIALLHPSATSVLIHNFVFGWAAEWVFFFCEILALFIYYYTFGKMEKKNHLIIGWLYFLFAWLSLFLINGIVAFMLTPGTWLETGNFWQGFFNPSFWPSLFFRTFLAVIFAGIFGLLTASFIKDREVKKNLVRYCALWMIVPLVLLLLSAGWYLSSLPREAADMILGKNPEIIPFAKGFIIISAVIFLTGLAAAVKMPGSTGKPLAFVLLAIGLMYMGSFEWVREAGRRPYVIYQHMYSNAIMPSQEKMINANGILKTARWVEYKEITEDNALEAGRRIFYLECAACHSIDGYSNDILPLTKPFTVFGMDSMLNGLGRINAYMPPFMGTDQERLALARYIVEGLHKKKKPVPSPKVNQVPLEPLPLFDENEDEYLVLAWNSLGMTCIIDSYPFWILMPMGNTISAQLIRRGELPEIVATSVDMTYEVEKGFENPSASVDFWRFAEELSDLDQPLALNTGLTGNSTSGKMQFNELSNAYEASKVPVTPYSEGKGYHPYPVFTITARDKTSGDILARTKMVAPVSTETGCRKCHGGPWRVDNRAGISDETAREILAVHDRKNKTDLLAEAEFGRPKTCYTCHSRSGQDKAGRENMLNLSTAIHGWHANFLTGRDESACSSCHPSDKNGSTACLRGVHASMGLTCINCHGTLEDHALSLLKHEKSLNKKGADRLMTHLSPREVSSVEDINPRMPWEQEPDCLNCHLDFEPPETDSAFNIWTETSAGLFKARTGDGGIRCAACHGTPHAVYPAFNMYAKNRDNMQPIQYQGSPIPLGGDRNCAVCHRVEMDYPLHHPNMEKMFRNTYLIDEE